MPEAVLSLHAVRRCVARVAVTGVLAASAGATALVIAPTSAFAANSTMESQFVAKVNAARESAGLRPYTVASDLISVARNHSAQMASRQSLYHNPNLTSDVQNWQAVGENVGEGPTVSDIHVAFMNSPEHRSNILDHDFTQIGVGVSVDSNGTIWVTEDFRQPMHSTSSSGTTTHTTSHPTTVVHHTTTTAPVARHTMAVSLRPVSHAGTSPHRAAPSPAATPAAVLMARLAAMRAASAQVATADPVTQTFSYLSTVSTISS
jgi:uncharacterized protein YkwD